MRKKQRNWIHSARLGAVAISAAECSQDGETRVRVSANDVTDFQQIRVISVWNFAAVTCTSNRTASRYQYE